MSEPEQPTAVAEPTSSTADRVTPETSDQRLLRGARARREIARHAVEVASAEGLNGLSIGRLAGDLGLSKSGIATLFGSKEKVQLAAVASAGEAFVDAVVRPASSAPHGAARVRALTEYWIAYAEAPLFAGGCFWGRISPSSTATRARSATRCCGNTGTGSRCSPANSGTPRTRANSPDRTPTWSPSNWTRCSRRRTSPCAAATTGPGTGSGACSTVS